MSLSKRVVVSAVSPYLSLRCSGKRLIFREALGEGHQLWARGDALHFDGGLTST